MDFDRQGNVDGPGVGADSRGLASVIVGRSCSTLMDRVDAIEAINFDAMMERCCKHFLCKKVPRDVLDVLNVLAMKQAKIRKHVTAEILNELVRDANECCRPRARSYIRRAVDLKLISCEKEGRNIYYYFDPDQGRCFRHVLRTKTLIRQVIDIQIKNPDNPTAGIELLLPEVYYNVIAYFPK